MSEDRITLETGSPSETEALGRVLFDLLPDPALVALRGELAAGKTCLVRGMASSLGGDPAVSSPTFTLVNEYGTDRKFYHLDLYRISGTAELIDLGCEELFDLDEGICVIEWAERAEPLLPERRADILIRHAGDDVRSIEVVNRGLLPTGWQERVRAALASAR